MASEQSKQSKKGFAEEFEELKARHGAQYADLRLVRFTDKTVRSAFGRSCHISAVRTTTATSSVRKSVRSDD